MVYPAANPFYVSFILHRLVFFNSLKPSATDVYLFDPENSYGVETKIYEPVDKEV